MNHRPRIIFFGTTNQLSLSAYEALLDGGVVPQATVVTAEAAGSPGHEPLEQLFPADSLSQLPLLNRFHEPTLIQASWAAGVPLYAVRKAGYQAVQDLLTRLRPDAVCVACFPWRLPEALLAMPPLGFLNLHPSLLPHYRGPAPLFWLFQKHDLAHRGVTVHQMDQGLDTGPLVRQESVRFADGLTQAGIERHCGQIGGRLLLESVDHLSSGRPVRPQTGQGSYHPWPAPADYELDPGWPATRAFNFMRATDGSPATYPLTMYGHRLLLVEALSVDPQGEQRLSVIRDGSVVHVQFQTGILTARLALG